MPPKKSRTTSTPRNAAPPRQPKPLPKSQGLKRVGKPPRYRPPPKMSKEIRELRSATDLLIPHAPFARLVREITMGITKCNEIRYQMSALKALHEAAEAYIIGLMEDSFLCSLHSKRVTLMARDIRLAYRIRGDFTRLGT